MPLILSCLRKLALTARIHLFLYKIIGASKTSKKRPRPLFRAKTNHTWHQQPNPSRETAPLTICTKHSCRLFTRCEVCLPRDNTVPLLRNSTPMSGGSLVSSPPFFFFFLLRILATFVPMRSLKSSGGSVSSRHRLNWRSFPSGGTDSRKEKVKRVSSSRILTTACLCILQTEGKDFQRLGKVSVDGESLNSGGSMKLRRLCKNFIIFHISDTERREKRTFRLLWKACNQLFGDNIHKGKTSIIG